MFSNITIFCTRSIVSVGIEVNVKSSVRSIPRRSSLYCGRRGMPARPIPPGTRNKVPKRVAISTIFSDPIFSSNTFFPGADAMSLNVVSPSSTTNNTLETLVFSAFFPSLSLLFCCCCCKLFL